MWVVGYFIVWYIKHMMKIWPKERKNIELLEFMLDEGKYTNGQRYKYLAFGSKGVIKSYPIWESNYDGVYSYWVDNCPILHNYNTGECYRDSNFNISNYPNIISTQQ